jgi:hypothetical protein
MSKLTALAGQWKVVFAKGSDPTCGSISYVDGQIQLWKKNRMVLVDHHGVVVEGRYLGSDAKPAVGNLVFFHLHFAMVIDCDMSSVEVRDPGSSLTNSAWHWKIMYSVAKDLDRGRLKAYDGTLILLVPENLLILKNAKGSPIVVKSESAEHAGNVQGSFKPGSKLKFPMHSVRVGQCLLHPSVSSDSVVVATDNAVDPFGSGSSKEFDTAANPIPTPVAPEVITNGNIDTELTSSAVFDSLALGLNFEH